VRLPVREAARAIVVAASLAAGARKAVDASHTRVMRLELTKRGDYAVRAMLALAHAPDGRRISVRRIAEEMTIPVRFLPQVMSDLAGAGLVEATTGRAGGYRLARPATDVSLLDVVEAVEGDSRRRTCVLRGGPCGLDGHCDVHDVFFEAQDAMLGALARARLADLPLRRGGHVPEVADRPGRLGA
jgi:Rrf2 family iron-sulfur cluster assembly transcriptional regulator